MSPSGAHAAPVASGMIGLQQGSRGDAVRSLQQALVSAGMNVTGGVDGIFGVGTAAAVKQFQSAKGLSATGVVDESTAAALAGGLRPWVSASPLFGLKIGATGDAVRQLQATLVARGFKTNGDADGTFGVNTVNALTSFQYAQRIKVTAKVDEATLAALGTPAPVPAAAPAPAAPARRSSRRARCSGSRSEPPATPCANSKPHSSPAASRPKATPTAPSASTPSTPSPASSTPNGSRSPPKSTRPPSPPSAPRPRPRRPTRTRTGRGRCARVRRVRRAGQSGHHAAAGAHQVPASRCVAVPTASSVRGPLAAVLAFQKAKGCRRQASSTRRPPRRWR